MAGNLPTLKDTWDIAEDLLSGITNEIDISNFDTYLNIAPHDKIERLINMKKMGIKQVQYNLEIANKEIFEYTCPGKLKYDDFVNKLKEAVNIMGKGNVRSNY
jgi:biotin synthase-related radical SAM superfamily protein